MHNFGSRLSCICLLKVQSLLPPMHMCSQGAPVIKSKSEGDGLIFNALAVAVAVAG